MIKVWLKLKLFSFSKSQDEDFDKERENSGNLRILVKYFFYLCFNFNRLKNINNLSLVSSFSCPYITIHHLYYIYITITVSLLLVGFPIFMNILVKEANLRLELSVLKSQ